MFEVEEKLERAIRRGLKSRKAEKSVPCFPTYVTDVTSPTGKEKGVYLVVDFGAPHLQIIGLDIKDGE